MKKRWALSGILIVLTIMASGASRAEDDQACADMVAAFEAQNATFDADEVLEYCRCMQRVNREVGFAPTEEEMAAFEKGGPMPPKMMEATMKGAQECKMPVPG